MTILIKIIKKQNTTDPYLKRWHRWRDKVSELSKQILELKTEGEPTVIAISKFLLTSQLVEFKLRELLLTLGFSEWLKSGKDYISDPADFDNDNQPYTLGTFINKELVKYTNVVGVKRLLSRLRRLNKQRKEFVHRLFGSHLPIEKLEPLSVKGTKLGELILWSMFEIQTKMNDKQDKYLNRIKRLKHPTRKEEILRQIWIGKVEPEK